MSETLAFDRHDHAACRRTALTAAEARCAAEGLRLTPARRRVLELLLESHTALGAYDLMDRLREEGQAAQPPAVYRALDFLVTNGFAHRLEAQNAFIACAHAGDEGHRPVFLVCRSCKTVAEVSVGAAPLGDEVAGLGFTVERLVIEAEGLCDACAEAAA